MKDRKSVSSNGKAAFYACVFQDLREAAMDCGWALGLHGSLSNDMDIMAMPWVENASSVEDLIKSLKSCFTDNEKIVVQSILKPRGRKAFTLSIWGDFFLDISIDSFAYKSKDEVIEWLQTHPLIMGDIDLVYRYLIANGLDVSTEVGFRECASMSTKGVCTFEDFLRWFR